MEDSKLQALHDALSQLRGQKGLGTNSRFSWQRGANASATRHPAAAKLPNNVLYANFLPEGVYDPNASRIKDFGDGRIVKRDFSDAIAVDDQSCRANVSPKGTAGKEQQKALRKAEKKEAKKAAKRKAKKEAKLEEKKRQKKLAKKLLKSQLSGQSENSSVVAIVDAEKAEQMQRGSPITAVVKSPIVADNVVERPISDKKQEKTKMKVKTKRRENPSD